jgi:hypothetical protein
VEVVPRSVWGARPPKSVKNITTSEFLFVHHSVTDDGDDDYNYHEDEHALVRQIQNYHMDTKGWQDIAYSFMVGQSGRVYMGRGWGVAGGHTEGWNSRSHAVCWMGNSDIHVPTQMSLDAIEAVHAEYLTKYPRSPKRSHREVHSTGCPGGRLYAYVNTHPYPSEDNVPLTTNEIDAIAKRVVEYLVNPDPTVNPGVVVADNIEAAIADIQTKVTGLGSVGGTLVPDISGTYEVKKK